MLAKKSLKMWYVPPPIVHVLPNTEIRDKKLKKTIVVKLKVIYMTLLIKNI